MRPLFIKQSSHQILDSLIISVKTKYPQNVSKEKCIRLDISYKGLTSSFLHPVSGPLLNAFFLPLLASLAPASLALTSWALTSWEGQGPLHRSPAVSWPSLGPCYPDGVIEN